MLRGIVVSKEFRNIGLSKILLNHIFDKYTKNIAMFLLWSDLIDLYNKFDFHLSIGQIEYSCSQSDSKKNHNNHYLITKTLYKSISHSEKKQIHELYRNIIEQQYTTFHREKTDWELIEKITSADLFIITNIQNQKQSTDSQIVAYYFANKGQDLKNVVHEFAILNEHQSSILPIIFEQNPHAKIWLPESGSTNFFDAKFEKKYMGLIKIGDKKIFLNFIHQWSNEEIKIKSINNNNITFTYNKQIYFETIEKFLTFIFGPNPLSEWKHYGKPIFISGLDSI
ncbi:MAG: hypothetical protein HQK51_03365 [Oligoflexia bacterium]|nr:hypothetical protein [Oligoflexia bacterium]